MPGPIRLGDVTTGGGTVVSCALGSFYTIDGKPGAVLGDMATCVAHQGTFPFVESDTSTTFNELGVVLQGHKLACGCTAISSAAPTFNIDPTSPAFFPASPSPPASDICLDCLMKAAKTGHSIVARG